MAVMGIIGCNVLSNELVYLIRRDPQILKVTIIDTPEGQELADKLEKAHACQVIELSGTDLLRSRSYRSDEVIVLVNSPDLHDNQAKMKRVLECQMEQLSSMVDGLFMMYGQCRCQRMDVSTLESELGVPILFLTDGMNAVVDDCFAAYLGGCQQYLDIMREKKGTLFVTPGYVTYHVMMQRKLNLISVLEEVEQIGQVLSYMDYRKVLKLDNQIAGDTEYDALVDMFCKTFDLEVSATLCNLAVFEDSYDLAKNSMRVHARARMLLESCGVVWE